MMSWSRTQSVVSQSSAESEFFGILAGANEGVAMASVLAEVGISLPVVIYTDSSAGKSICLRLGAGALKHVETRFFHLQQMVRAKRLEVPRCAGLANPADLGTKAVTRMVLDTFLRDAGLREVNEMATVSAVANRPGSRSSKNFDQAGSLLGLIAFLQSCLK